MERTLHILLVDDDSVDATTFRRAVHRSGLAVTLDHVRDGVEALVLLRDPQARNPQLIVLDLRMPRMNGLEFLDAKARDDALRPIPSVVFTTSGDAKDHEVCDRLGASGFIRKPSDTDAYVALIGRLFEDWTEC